MSGIVLELQRECLDENASITGLLRKALVVAKKLGVATITDWIDHELRGYERAEDIPEYRKVRGRVVSWNPYNQSWMPVIFEDPEHEKLASQRTCGQAVAEIESLVSERSDKAVYTMPFPAGISNRMMQSTDMISPPVVQISEAVLHRILDAVRNTILEWTLQLEKEGITGEGLTFSEAERRSAQNITFNIGSMSHSQIQQGTETSIQTQSTQEIDISAVGPVIQAIRQALPKLELNSEQHAELEADLTAAEAQVRSPSPKQTVLRECLGSARRILEGAAGGALGAGLLSQLAALLG